MKNKFFNKKKYLLITIIFSVITVFSVIFEVPNIKSIDASNEEKILMQDYGWQLIYEHDKDGKRINGNKNKLITAVQAGIPIRVGIIEDNSKSYFEPSWLTLRDGEVFAQHTTHISAEWEKENLMLNFKNDAYHWFIIVNSQGKFNASRWLVGEHKSKGNSSLRLHLKWFVELPTKR